MAQFTGIFNREVKSETRELNPFRPCQASVQSTLSVPACHRLFVGVEGIEPSVSASRTQRDTDSLHSGAVIGGQAEPCVQPDRILWMASADELVSELCLF